VEKHNLQFEVLSDVGNKIARKYGLVFRLPQEMGRLYKKNIDFESYYGSDTDELPIPATYIVDTDGVVRYAFIDADYTRRADPKEILLILNRMAKSATDPSE